jgi:hypothetical protein
VLSSAEFKKKNDDDDDDNDVEVGGRITVPRAAKALSNQPNTIKTMNIKYSMVERTCRARASRGRGRRHDVATELVRAPGIAIPVSAVSIR